MSARITARKSVTPVSAISGVRALDPSSASCSSAFAVSIGCSTAWTTSLAFSCSSAMSFGYPESGSGNRTGMEVEKRRMFEPSTSSPPEQDQYEYWVYSFDRDGRVFEVRRYCDDPDEAMILTNIGDGDEGALQDTEPL